MSACVYQVFGLRIALPHAHRLLPIATVGSLDAMVRYGEVPETLPKMIAERMNPLMQAHVAIGDAAQVLWTSRVGRFLVTGGDSIEIQLNSTVARGAEVNPGVVLRFVLFYCLPALLIQRGQLSLHANAAVTSSGAVVIGGESGAGKSTLLASLVAAGSRMLSDDVTAIYSDADGCVRVAAGFPQFRLCEDAVDRIAPPADRVRALGGPRKKFSVSALPSEFHSRAAPLRAIYLIEKYDGRELQVDMLAGVHKMSALRAVSYPPMSIAYVPSQLQALAAIASATPVYRVRRPQQRWTVNELMSLVNEELGHGAQVGT